MLATPWEISPRLSWVGSHVVSIGPLAVKSTSAVTLAGIGLAALPMISVPWGETTNVSSVSLVFWVVLKVSVPLTRRDC
jgi:hypothetical protein